MQPATFRNNGFTVVALQAAWSAIVHSGRTVSGPGHVEAALTAAIQIGHDTDTVAAIAGALLGARYGASALPFRWTRLVHGWPDLRAGDLAGSRYGPRPAPDGIRAARPPGRSFIVRPGQGKRVRVRS